MKKYGPSLGIALDESTTNLNSVAYATLAPAVKGVDQTGNTNADIASRQTDQNIDTSAGFASQTILGTQGRNLGKSQVQYSGASAVAAQADSYIQFILATIRLKGISPVLAAMPMTRNIKGFIYVNYNSASVKLQNNAAGTSWTNWATTTNYGRVMPALITSDFTPAAGNSTLQEYALTCEISGVQSSSLSTAAPPINYARIVAPYYVANPTIDASLSMKKTFRYLERNVTTFNLGANSNLTVTLSPGITNPKRVVLLPYFTTINSVTYNPLLSPFDTVPGTSSPLAALKDLQILVAGKPAFQNPVQMDYEMFLQELLQMALMEDRIAC